MTVLAEPPAPDATAPHPDAAGWASLAARILVADMLGDRESALDLLDALVTDSVSAVRSAMLLWCDMAIQAAQVMDVGVVWIPLDGDLLTRLDADVVWASGLLSARSVGDRTRVDDLFHSVTGVASWNDRVLRVLDMTGSVMAAGLAFTH